MSLFTRLLWLIGIALLPTVAIQSWASVRQHRERETALRAEALSQTRGLQDDLTRTVGGMRQLLGALSQLPSVRAGDATACTAYLKAVAAQDSDYALLAATDAEGGILCNSAGSLPGAYSNAKRAYFQRAMATGAFAVGDLTTGVVSHRPTVHFALPFRRTDGAVGGVVLASLDQQHLLAQVASSLLAPDALAMVIDPAGTVAAGAEGGHAVTDGWVGRALPAALGSKLEATKPSVVEADGPDGVPRVFGILPPDPSLGGLSVAVGLDRGRTFAGMRGRTRDSLVGIALGFVLALLAGGLGARRYLVAPLLRIGAAADRVGRGDLDAKAGLARHGREIREVGAAFDRMSTALAEREVDRDLAEAARRVSDERYRTLFEAIEVGFCIVEMRFEGEMPVDYRFLEINPAFAAQTGLRDAEGRWMRDLAPDHEQHWFDVYGRVSLTGEAIRFEDEAKALGRWYDVHAFRAGAPADRRVAILFNDITARRRMELDLRDVNANLERRVAEAVEERGQAEDALRQSQKLEAVGQLTGGVAHDFNNLLTVLRSSVDLLRRPNLAEERRRRYLDAISDTVDRAARLTGQLLAFARRQALKPEVFDARERVHAVSDMLDSVTGARVRVVVELSDEPCHVRADPSQFETALVNMAVNARDAMAGEGTLTLRVHDGGGLPPIRGHAGSAAAFVAVSLADTGAGIAPGELPHIFEPFFTTKGVGKGTGLGLSQVFGFAKQSGGDVDVASEPGRGTAFTLYLPHVPAPAPAGEDEPPAAVAVAAGHRVLVVEDNVEIGRFATQLLDDLGYRSTWAINADEALARLATPEPEFDVVFSDVVMPGTDGVDLAREIRRRHPDLPVVLTSGYSHVLAREGPQGVDLVHKPYSAGQVAQALQRALTENRSRSAPRRSETA